MKYIRTHDFPKTSLLNYKRNVFSQFGEDGIIEYIFKVIPSNKHPWSVEFGAWDGQFLSNTCNLITNHGWSGIYIESDKRKFRELLKNHGVNPKVHCINKFVGFEGRDTLDNILKKVKELPVDFDLLSIDVDSVDYYIWESLKNYKPKVVIMEFNPTIPVDYEYIQPKDFGIHNEHSLISVVKLGKRKGYELICCTDINAIFVKKRFFNLFRIKDNSPKVMFKPFESLYLSQIWQGMDGTLHLIGCNRLLWHNFKISEKKIQVLPRFLRFYPGINSPFLHFLQKVKNRVPVINKFINFVVTGKWELPVRHQNYD